MSAHAQVPVVLGVDGGASKTACTALLVSTHEQLSQAFTGPSNWYDLQHVACCTDITFLKGRPFSLRTTSLQEQLIFCRSSVGEETALDTLKDAISGVLHSIQ